MFSMPATGVMVTICSTLTGLRNCARGLSAPLAWFLDAIRASTSRSSVLSTPYFLA
jgi:hypothetical protein